MMALSGAVFAQRRRRAPPPPDFSKVEIKTTDLGDNCLHARRPGRKYHRGGGERRDHHGGRRVRAAARQDQGRHRAVSNQPIKYLINTHFHGDHTGGNEPFAKDGVTVVAQINVRKRLAAGTTNGLTGAKTPPAPPGALPSKTYTGAFKIRLEGRVADLKHIANAHTDGDTYVWFKTANVLSTGDTFTNGRYPNIDFANGGNIKGMIAATDAYLKLTNAKTRIVPGHGPLADKAALIGIPHDADHRARPHGETGQGRQERGRRGRGEAVRRSRCQMGADRTWRPRISFASSITRSPTSRKPSGRCLKRMLRRN